MITMNVRERKTKIIILEEGQRDVELYKEIWKKKYNVVIAKEGDSNYEKILNYVKGKNS